MASEIRVTNIKANDGTSSLTVANSTGNVYVGGTLTSSGALTASGGITNAGTISAGTLGSSVVFPAGHIIQTNYYHYNSGNSGGINTATPTIFTLTGTSQQVYKATISNLTSGNDVLVTMSFPCYIYKAGKMTGHSFHIWRDSDIVYGTGSSSGNKRELFQYTEGSVSEVVAASRITLTYIDENPTSTSRVYYVGSSHSSGTGGTAYLYASSAGAGPFTSVIQEIQR